MHASYTDMFGPTWTRCRHAVAMRVLLQGWLRRGFKVECPAMEAISGGVMDRRNRIECSCRRGACCYGHLTGELCWMVCLCCKSEVSMVLQSARKQMP
jgi:hypothetical protein